MQFTVIEIQGNNLLCENVGTGERVLYPTRSFRREVPVVGETYIFEVLANNIKIHKVS